MPTRLEVLREFQGTCQLVGCLKQAEGSVVFSYDESYLAEGDAAPISAVLPLRSAPFPPATTRAFFDGLLPEGSLRRSLAAAAHSDPAAFDAAPRRRARTFPIRRKASRSSRANRSKRRSP